MTFTVVSAAWEPTPWMWFEPLCESFSLSVDLPEGIYDGDATLVDSLDRSATDPYPVDAIDIVGDTELVVDIDFPVGSFL